MIDKTHTIPAATVAIGDVKLPVLTLQDQRVVTLAMIDEVHGRPEGTARKRFNEHKPRFIEGEDFMVRSASEIRTRFPGVISARATEDLTLLTETGYLMLVKSFQDDLAWEVQRKLVTSYFRMKLAGGVMTEIDAHVRHVLGGIVKGVIGKALDDRLEPVERAVLTIAGRLDDITSPSGRFKTSTEYVPALSVVNDFGVPQKGRGGLVRRISNALDRFCRREGILAREEAHTGRRLYHVDAVSRWLAAGGREIIRRHMSELAGQTIITMARKADGRPILTAVPTGREAV